MLRLGLQITCTNEIEEGHSYADYTITFASVTNGFIGFSTEDYTVYTEIVYVVLPGM